MLWRHALQQLTEGCGTLYPTLEPAEQLVTTSRQALQQLAEGCGTLHPTLGTC